MALLRESEDLPGAAAICYTQWEMVRWFSFVYPFLRGVGNLRQQPSLLRVSGVMADSRSVMWPAEIHLFAKADFAGRRQDFESSGFAAVRYFYSFADTPFAGRR